MGLKLDIDLKQLEKVDKRVREIAYRVEDVPGAAPGIRLLIQQDVDARFRSAPRTGTGGEVLGGEYWEALSDQYLQSNPRRINGQILRDTGELQQSLTIVGHPYEVFEVNQSSVTFGTALVKASSLQKKRPFIFWHPALLQKVADFLVNYIGG